MKVDKAGFFLGVSLTFAVVVLHAGCQQASSPINSSEDPTESAAPPVGSPVMESAAPLPTASSPARGSANESEVSEQIAPPQPRTVTLAAGTGLKVRTTSALSTESHQAGESFTATLEEPLVEGNWVIAPQGATVEGWIVEADEGGRVQGVARLSIQLAQLHTADGQIIEINTNPFVVEAETTKREDATKIGIGAGIGAVIGAIAGGKKGAGIGAATGAGAGTGVVLATRGDAAVIGSETVLDFELQSPVTVTERT